jgi:hypothetical protein
VTLFFLLLIAIERPRRRAEERFALGETASCNFNELDVPCRVLDLSPGGAKLQFDHELTAAQGTEVAVELDGIGELKGRIVWAAKGNAGIRFAGLGERVRGALTERLLELSLDGSGEGKRAQRVDISIPASCRLDQVEADCLIENASTTGLLIRLAGIDPTVGTVVSIDMPGVGIVPGKVVRRLGEERFGVAFLPMPDGTRDRLIRRLYTHGIGYPQQLDIRGGALFRALFARAFG